MIGDRDEQITVNAREHFAMLEENKMLKQRVILLEQRAAVSEQRLALSEQRVEVLEEFIRNREKAVAAGETK